MSNPRLASRIAIVTGSSGRLGRAISLLFAHEGATLFLVDKYPTPRNPINPQTGKADDWESRYKPSSSSSSAGAVVVDDDDDGGVDDRWVPTHELIARMGGQVSFHAADLTSETAVHDMVKSCVDRFGRVDILINAHGISVESTHQNPTPVHLTDLSDFERTMSINTTSVFLTMKYFLTQVHTKQEQLHEGGRGWIVNIASVQALTPYFGTPSYCASKGAVLMLTKQVALDYAPLGIRCNAVCPGFLDSEMTGNLKADETLLETVAKRHPLWTGIGKQYGLDSMSPAAGPGKGGLGKAEDVARMVLVLASDDARWVTGQGVVVDGGYSIS